MDTLAAWVAAEVVTGLGTKVKMVLPVDHLAAVAAVAEPLTVGSTPALVVLVEMALSSLLLFNMSYIDQNGLTWTRSEDRLFITCEDGRKVLGTAEMTDEYLVSVAYIVPEAVKTDADRIAELEAKLAALLSRL